MGPSTLIPPLKGETTQAKPSLQTNSIIFIATLISINGLLGIAFEPTSSWQVSQPLRLLVGGGEGLRFLLFHTSK